jgi:hypothetical protein
LGGAAFDNDKSSEMKPFDLKSMSEDELRSLHELVAAALARKIQAKTETLNQRLRQLALITSHMRRVTRGRNIEIRRSRSRLGQPWEEATLVDRLTRRNRSTISGSIKRRRKLASGFEPQRSPGLFYFPDLIAQFVQFA